MTSQLMFFGGEQQVNTENLHQRVAQCSGGSKISTFHPSASSLANFNGTTSTISTTRHVHVYQKGVAVFGVWSIFAFIIKRILGIKRIFPCSFGNKRMRLLTHVYGNMLKSILQGLNLFFLKSLFPTHSSSQDNFVNISPHKKEDSAIDAWVCLFASLHLWVARFTTKDKIAKLFSEGFGGTSVKFYTITKFPLYNKPLYVYQKSTCSYV